MLSPIYIERDSPRGLEVVDIELNLRGCLECCDETMLVVEFMGNRERTNSLI